MKDSLNEENECTKNPDKCLGTFGEMFGHDFVERTIFEEETFPLGGINLSGRAPSSIIQDLKCKKVCRVILCKRCGKIRLTWKEQAFGKKIEAVENK